MLIVRAWINSRLIEEELHIQNVGEDQEAGYFKYLIRVPLGYSDTKISHKRDDGWMILASKAIRLIEMQDAIRAHRLDPSKPLALPESKSQTRRKAIQRRSRGK